MLNNVNSNGIKILDKYRGLIWKEIKKYLSDPVYPYPFDVPSKFKKEHDFHWKLVSEYPERQGKYLRPALVFLTCEAMGGNKRKALKTAAAMQTSEDWFLIHDDLEDKSVERRGKATLHRMYSSELAVNAGDALQIIMWKIISDNQGVLGAQKTVAVTNEFYKILTRTALGQTSEIRWIQKNITDFSDNDWLFISDGKTSYYTIAGPMRLGAIIAGVNYKQLEKITEFGLFLGRCFQLVDDILDVTSDFAGLKKQTGNDIREGKRTILLGHLLRNAKRADKKKVIKIMNRAGEKKTEEDVNWIIKKMHQYGSIEYARSLAKKFKDRAYQIFNEDLTFLSNQPARKDLETLIHFVLERNH